MDEPVDSSRRTWSVSGEIVGVRNERRKGDLSVCVFKRLFCFAGKRVVVGATNLYLVVESHVNHKPQTSSLKSQPQIYSPQTCGRLHRK